MPSDEQQPNAGPTQEDKQTQELKRLASRYEEFCHPMGDRLLLGTAKAYDKEGNVLLSRFENKVKHVDGRTVGTIECVYNPVADPDAVVVYDDDIRFRKMLEHPAFREFINERAVLLDIGNGGNHALREDAAFLKRNGFEGKVIGIDPFHNKPAINAENGLVTEAVREDGLSYLLEQPSGSANVLCSFLEDEIINDNKYAQALVREIFRVVPERGVFICIRSNALETFAEQMFTYTYRVESGRTLFTKTPIEEQVGTSADTVSPDGLHE